MNKNILKFVLILSMLLIGSFAYARVATNLEGNFYRTEYLIDCNGDYSHLVAEGTMTSARAIAFNDTASTKYISNLYVSEYIPTGARTGNSSFIGQISANGDKDTANISREWTNTNKKYVYYLKFKDNANSGIVRDELKYTVKQ